MLITADWVLPVSRPPIRNGAVVIHRGHIVEVDEARNLAGMPDTDERYDFPDCVLLPGLVNAHTHLSLCAMEELLPPEAFDSWQPRLAKGMQSWKADDFAASAAVAAQLCIQGGVTVVGDIAYGPESLAAAADAGLGGVFYWEVTGISARMLRNHLAHMDFPSDARDCGDRVRCGLSPHSTYTSGPDLIKAIHQIGRKTGAAVAMHVAESAAESELLIKGTGPLAETANRLIKGFEPPGVSGVAYLDQLDALDGITTVHLGHSLPTDIPRLASAVRGVVTCPRSNRYLSPALPRLDRIIKAGIPIGIGTDSAARDGGLDLFEEARVVKAAYPQMPAGRLIEMMTSMGSVALGLEERFGILERGMHADVAVVRTGPSDSPESDLIRLGGADTIEAVLSAGEWRVLNGKALRKTDPATIRAAKAATAKAKAAIDES